MGGNSFLGLRPQVRRQSAFILLIFFIGQAVMTPSFAGRCHETIVKKAKRPSTANVRTMIAGTLLALLPPPVALGDFRAVPAEVPANERALLHIRPAFNGGALANAPQNLPFNPRMFEGRLVIDRYIDHFDTPKKDTVVKADKDGRTKTRFFPAEASGGEREVTEKLISAAGIVKSEIVGTDLFVTQHGHGKTLVVWDGVDAGNDGGNSEVDSTGLGQENFLKSTRDNSVVCDRIIVGISAKAKPDENEVPGTIEITVYDTRDGGRQIFSRATLEFKEAGRYVVAFNDLKTAGPRGFADLSQVGALSAEIDVNPGQAKDAKAVDHQPQDALANGVHTAKVDFLALGYVVYDNINPVFQLPREAAIFDVAGLYPNQNVAVGGLGYGGIGAFAAFGVGLGPGLLPVDFERPTEHLPGLGFPPSYPQLPGGGTSGGGTPPGMGQVPAPGTLVMDVLAVLTLASARGVRKYLRIGRWRRTNSEDSIINGT